MKKLKNNNKKNIVMKQSSKDNVNNNEDKDKDKDEFKYYVTLYKLPKYLEKVI